MYRHERLSGCRGWIGYLAVWGAVPQCRIPHACTCSAPRALLSVAVEFQIPAIVVGPCYRLATLLSCYPAGYMYLVSGIECRDTVGRSKLSSLLIHVTLTSASYPER